MQLDQALDDRQPEPQAAEVARRRGVPLAEPLEQMRDEIRVDANPGVRNADLDVRVHTPEGDLHLPLFLRELDGV